MGCRQKYSQRLQLLMRACRLTESSLIDLLIHERRCPSGRLKNYNLDAHARAYRGNDVKRPGRHCKADRQEILFGRNLGYTHRGSVSPR